MQNTSQSPLDFYEVTTDEQLIKAEADILRLMEKTYPQRKLLLKQANLHPDFFDLSTGLAGAVLQKLAQYELTTAIVIDLSTIKSERFRELANEANVGADYGFFPTREKAMEWLALVD